MVLVAKQRSELQRVEYLHDMQVFHGRPETLVFVDETSADGRNCLRRFGYSLRGRPAVSKKLLVRGQRVPAIASMSTDGIVNYVKYTGSVTGDKFKHFIRYSLFPQLLPFDGVNLQSIIVLDNAAIDHAGGVVDLIESIGALVQFLPPYSPDLNSIEEAFLKSEVKLKS